LSAQPLIPERLLGPLTTRDVSRCEAALCEEASLRVWRWDGAEAYRARANIAQRLTREWSAWSEPVVTPLRCIEAGEQVALEFRIQVLEGARYVEHNRTALLKLKGEQLLSIELYCAAPVHSARRSGWIAPAGLSEGELHRLFDTLPYMSDPREWIPPTFAGRRSLTLRSSESGDAHPGSNEIADVRWSAEEADARIQEIIEHHRAHGRGFRWTVGPYDTPADLHERLERHGLVRAGEQAIMARLGLEAIDIPTNPEVTIETLDDTRAEPIDALMEIVGRCFNWTPEQSAERRPGLVERLENPEFRKTETWYLARINGKPVGYAQGELKSGIAFLAGAATHPEYRGKRVYSTLLNRRLKDAHARGYHLAAIVAEPMSRHVVGRHGFKQYAKSHIYAWMPVIDMDVIRSLVATE